ncbi:MAG: sulfite exporter TauE/SafE family protein, partial [Hungatella sp.]
MSIYLYVIFLAVSFGASIVGAICGIGGGVLIKPLLDAFGVLSVSAISFLSGCTVLSMSCYSVGKAKLSGESLVDGKIGTPLAIG